MQVCHSCLCSVSSCERREVWLRLDVCQVLRSIDWVVCSRHHDHHCSYGGGGGEGRCIVFLKDHTRAQTHAWEQLCLTLSLSPFPYTYRLLITFTNPTLIMPQSHTTQTGRATNTWNNSHIVIVVSLNFWNIWMQIADFHIQSPYLL